jgi:hypothetical protein
MVRLLIGYAVLLAAVLCLQAARPDCTMQQTGVKWLACLAR